jgi:ribonuclease P/MRP protein subunit RPP40
MKSIKYFVLKVFSLKIESFAPFEGYIRSSTLLCIQAVGPDTVADKLCLEMVEMRAVKMVSDIGGGTYTDKLAKLNLTTLEERRWRGDMIWTWRIMTGKDMVKVETWFDLEVDRQRVGWGHHHQTYQADLCYQTKKLQV